MPSFSGGNGGSGFTPSTTQDNWTLDYGVTAGTFGKVVSIGWGGSAASSVGYRTRWTRPTAAGTGARTAITLAYNQPNYVAAGATLVSQYASTQPTLAADPSGNLHSQDWNNQGGLGLIVFPLANPWWISNGVLQSGISCRNTKGTDAGLSSYAVTFEE
jgi:hypothetical protein